VNEVFAKMWTAVGAEKFTRFTDLAGLLRYLKMCAHSTIMDHVRRARHHTGDLLSERLLEDGWEPHKKLTDVRASSAEEAVLAGLSAEGLWREVSNQLHDELEALVVYCSIVLAETPREIYAHHRDRFASIQQVYSTKRNVLARLKPHFQRRQHDTFCTWLSD
jgi:hypothetical protein